MRYTIGRVAKYWIWVVVVLASWVANAAPEQRPPDGGAAGNSEAVLQRAIGSLETTAKSIGGLEASTKSLGDRVEKLSTKLEDADKNIQDAKNNLVIAAALLATGIAGVISYSRAYVKRRIEKIAAQHKQDIEALEKNFLGDLEKRLNDRLEKHAQEVKEAVERAALSSESKAYDYIQVATLRYAQKYDEALTAVGWNGEPKQYANYPEAVQRHLIACLTKGQKARESNDNVKAWGWVVSLMNASPTVDNVEAMLRTAKELRHANEAIELYDKVLGNLGTKDQDRCEQFIIVLLRRSPTDALKKSRLQRLAQKHRNSKDIQTQTTIAAVYRDEGMFEDADSIMRSAVKRMTGFAPWQNGWDKLFNTYIANCIDLERPGDAVQQVKTLLASFNRPDHVFNCARVAWRLPVGDADRAELLRLIQVRFDDGLMPEKDDGTVKTLALIQDLRGDTRGAERTLRSAIAEMTKNNSPWARDQVYFYRCALAELLLGHDEAPYIELAIKELEEPTYRDSNGEASYLMAKALAKKGDSDQAIRFIDAAAKIKLKWIKRAKKDSAFQGLDEIDNLIGKYAAPLSA